MKLYYVNHLAFCSSSNYNMAIYNGMPSYQFSSALKSVEVLDLLSNTLPEDSSVCVSKPIGIRRSATFIVARKCLGNSDDIKADDLGVWVHKGKPVRSYKVSRLPSGEVYGVELTSQGDVADVFQLTRIYYHHNAVQLFDVQSFMPRVRLRFIIMW